MLDDDHPSTILRGPGPQSLRGVEVSQSQNWLPVPTLSVIIPVHDRALTVAHAICSVLNDDPENAVEVVVVDDGSTDNIVAAIDAIGDPRVILCRRSHAGVAVARNAGVAASSAPFVAFLDSDDAIEPGWVHAFVQASIDGFELFSCATHERRPDGRSTVEAPSMYGAAYAGLTLRFQAGAFGLSRSAFAESGGYLAGLKHGEGSQFLMSVAELHLRRGLRIGWTDQPLVTINRRDRPYDAALYYESGKATLLASSVMLARDRVGHARLLSIVGVAASRLGKRREAAGFLSRAIWKDPLQWRHSARLIRAVVGSAKPRTAGESAEQATARSPVPRS